MNILLIFPRVKNYHPDLKHGRDFFAKLFGEVISLTLPQVAGATPKKHSVKIIDENYETIDFNETVDLVGITCLTMAAPRAYEIADTFRARKIPVVLGGNHPSALPEEAKQHADSVIIGEAELIWPQLLEDFEKDRLQPFYWSKNEIPSESIPEPRRDLIQRKYYTDGLLIRRGCPNRCEFCTVTSLYSQEIRSIEQVLKEIDHIAAKTIFIYDQNLTWNMTYTNQLLTQLQKFHKRWLANGTVNVLGKNDAFLQLAKDAGIFYWYIGFESISQKSLDGAHKKHNRVEQFAATIQKIKQYGMVVVGSFMFGFDEDTPDIFDTTLQVIADWGLDMAEFHILTPFPGTALYTRFKKKGRIITEDWRKYNTANVVFEPKQMSAQELFEGTRRIARKYYTLPHIAQRAYRAFETTKDILTTYYVLQQNVKYRLRFKDQFGF